MREEAAVEEEVRVEVGLLGFVVARTKIVHGSDWVCGRDPMSKMRPELRLEGVCGVEVEI